jgi:hypothetical protein
MVCVTRAYRLSWFFAASRLVQIMDWWAGGFEPSDLTLIERVLWR